MDDTYRYVPSAEMVGNDNVTADVYTRKIFQMEEYDKGKFEVNILRQMNTNQFQIFIPTFAFVSLLMAVGIPGNILAILVYVTQLKKGVARYFILTLAVSDLITCSCIAPLELWIMTHFWTFDNQGLCKIFRFVAYGVNNISSLILLAIAFERYRLICSPWKQKFTANCSKLICIMAILVALLTSIPMIFIYGTFTMPFFRHSSIKGEMSLNTSIGERNMTNFIIGKTCMVDDKMAGSLFPFYTNAVYITATVLVFCILIYLYGCIARQLMIQKHQHKNKLSENSTKNSSKRIRHVTIMVLVLTCVYEICFLPCLIIICIRLINPYLYQVFNFGEKMAYQFFLKSYLINSALNPCIYCYCNREFRLAACKIITKLKIFCSKDQERKLSQSYLTSGNSI